MHPIRVYYVNRGKVEKRIVAERRWRSGPDLGSFAYRVQCKVVSWPFCGSMPSSVTCGQLRRKPWHVSITCLTEGRYSVSDDVFIGVITFIKRYLWQVFKRLKWDDVLVRAAITKCHRLGGLNNGHLFSHNSGGWSPRSRYRQGRDEASLLGL